MIARFLLKFAALTSMVTPLGSGVAFAQSASDGVRVPAHERIVLANGLTLIIMPLRDVPLVAFNAVLRGGERGDSAGEPGVASLVCGGLA